MVLSFDELLGYTEGERTKWERWFENQPLAALQAPVQPEGRFRTVWQLMDHIFLVERRHTLRLEQQTTLPEETGVAEPDLPGLFAYARNARKELARVVHAMSPADAGRIIEFNYRDDTFRFTARKLAFHIQLHEVRHWAQIAIATRNAGLAPPGFHDLLFSDSLK
jgi:uncharacterized damage-inducible protein DinB